MAQSFFPQVLFLLLKLSFLFLLINEEIKDLVLSAVLNKTVKQSSDLFIDFINELKKE